MEQMAVKTALVLGQETSKEMKYILRILQFILIFVDFSILCLFIFFNTPLRGLLSPNGIWIAISLSLIFTSLVIKSTNWKRTGYMTLVALILIIVSVAMDIQASLPS